MTSLFRSRSSSLRRCTRCTRAAVVVVETGERSQVGACLEHLEWVFLIDVEEWTGRRRTV
jgi:hypothetical protein